jgi:hypothetical protein
VAVMSNIAVLIAIWALAFAILVVPARPIGKWMARRGDGFVHAILAVFLCSVIAFNVALVGWLALMIWGHEVFPHVKNDPMNFGILFATGLLFVPAFSALVAGYLRARKTALSRGRSGPVPT